MEDATIEFRDVVTAEGSLGRCQGISDFELDCGVLGLEENFHALRHTSEVNIAMVKMRRRVMRGAHIVSKYSG